MKIELNPVKWFPKGAVTTPATAAKPIVLPSAIVPMLTTTPSLYSEDGYLNRDFLKNMSTSAKAVESVMSNKFVTILEKIGSVFEKGLEEAVKFLPLATTLAGFLFPPAVAVLGPATTVADLLQKAVAEAEQKLAAQNNQTGSGATKLATVLTIVTSSVTGLLGDATVSAELKKAGITVDTTYITNLVNAVVSFLNVQGVVATS